MKSVLRRLLGNQSGQVATELGLGCGAVILIIVAILGIFSFHPVDAGHVGVVTSFGEIQQNTLKPGLNFLAPFVYGVTDVDTRVRGIDYKGDNKLAAASKEYQDVIVEGTLNLHVDPNAAVNLVQNVGLDYDQKLVSPFLANSLKEVTVKYAIGDVLAQRQQIRTQTIDLLKAKLAPYGIVVDDFAISNIDFSPEYKAAIEAKQVAEQQVLTEKQILEQAKIKADQVRTTAQGAADSVIIAAKAQAEANRLLQLSLTPELLQYTLIQKLAPTIQTMILPTGQNFILDPKSLVGAK